MVFKEDVLQWFRDLESYERINLMHELLHMCLPFEIRFLGGCVEEIGKHSFQELRGPSIVANDIDKLSKDITQFTAGVLDRNCRHRTCVYLSLLENRNCQCAHWYFKQVFRTEQWDEFAMRQKCIDDSLVLNELLVVFTLGRLHPAFNYHQKEFFGDVLEKLYRIRADKINAVKSAVDVGMPNYPPGFGYPNQIVPSYYVIQYDQSAASTPHHAPRQQILHPQQQPLDALCVVKTSTSSATASSTSSTSSVLSTAGAVGDLVAMTAPPGMVPHQPPFQPYEISWWRQQPLYNIPDPHMMAPPPQPISPQVSHSASPPHSRPTSPTLSNHSASSQHQQQQQQHQQQPQRSTPSSLRGSKSSSLDSHSSPQQVRMLNAAAVYTNATAHAQTMQSEQPLVKIGDSEINNHDDCSKSLNNCQQPIPFLHQDWTNHGPLTHLPVHPHFTFATHPHQVAPHPAQAQNGLRHCFAANFHPHHPIAMDPAMFGYDFEYHQQHQQQQQQQQQLNDIQLENSLHQSGSSSNNSSNASSLNQSPPDTPVSTPTPALHGPGRGNRDSGVTEKLRMLNNVNSVPFMTPPPPPISDGCNMSPQPHFTYNVPYTSLGGGRQIFTRIPSTFTHSFPAPPPMTPQQHMLAAQTQGGQPPPYITIGTTGHIVSPNVINSNGNNTVTGTGHGNSSITNTASLRLHPHHHHHHHQPQQHSTIATSTTSTANQPPLPTAPVVPSSPPGGACAYCCCNCGSSEHGDAACTAPRIDDIVTQSGYSLAYDDNTVAVLAPTPTAVDAGQHRPPDI